ncbi:hypothetical protein QA648_27495 (plasmid) [Rhizobium sp. CB3171]|uniref:hypothetical protein n=1 Tax=Rhizobium sp. CB3171 TaxID=3039157 RepID=UPI0024B13263|nr:hypothetical protein [Rhizobium sp. CB3171]WFU04528.1 hypothetical protein QA648_27495 [Rhizobium sp. CB3171]
MSKLKNFSALATIGVVACFSTIAYSAEKVEIITQSTPETGGKKVAARVWRRIDNGPWEEIDGERPGIGVLDLTEAKCDFSVSYKAAAMWGTHTRDVSSTHQCSEPQVLFNDFIPTGFASTIDLEQLTKSSVWVAALGQASSTTDGQRLASSFQTAITQGNYGSVAIASSEIAAQLRKAGNTRDADVFASLSVQATLNGIAKVQKLDPERLITLKADSDYTIVGEGAKSTLQTYQKSIGVTETSSGFGKTGWRTMRSLDGGSTTTATEFKLPSSAITTFDASKFSATQ